MKRWLIDGYNVLFSVHRGRAGHVETARRQLLAAIAQLSRSRQFSGTVVFDGTPGGSSILNETRHGELRLIFTGSGESADERIMALVNDADDPRNITVVSSDRRIIDCAKKCGAKPMRADEFTEALAKYLPAASDQPGPDEAGRVECDEKLRGIPRDGIEFWMKYFGEENPKS